MLIIPFKTEEPVSRFSLITYILIGINTVVFVIILFLSAGTAEILTMELGFVPDEWYRFHTAATSLFMHSGWLHLIGNMFFLWMFGRIAEQRLGAIRYILVYLISGIVGLATHTLTVSSYFSDLPCVGASGAISGILGAFAVCFPRLKLSCLYVWILFFRPLVGIMRIPAFLFIGGWFVIQLIYATSLGDITGVVGIAFWAHIGGFCFGALAANGTQLFSWVKKQFRILNIERKYQKTLCTIHDKKWDQARSLLQGLSEDPGFSHSVDYLSLQCAAQEGNTPDIVHLGKRVLDHSHGTGAPGPVLNAFYMLRNTDRSSVLTPHHLLGIGRNFMKMKKYGHAKDIFYAVLRDYPDNGENDLVLYALGELYRETGKPEQSQEILDLLNHMFPDSKVAGAK